MDSDEAHATSALEHQSRADGLQANLRRQSVTNAAKRRDILDTCQRRDVPLLVRLATSEGGLLDDECRRLAWPLLLGVSSSTKQPPAAASTILLASPENDVDSLPPHRDEHQVSLDVNRSFVYYPKESESSLHGRKEELDRLITRVLRQHPALCYFQGFHDIAQVLLLVLGSKDATPAVAHLSLLRIRDFMLPTMTAAVVHLQLLPTILRRADATLERHLSMTRPFFALPATLTMYAHDIQEFGDISRLFDFLLARESVISIYFFAVIVLARKDELLDVGPDEPEILHSILSKLPKPLDLEELIAKTVKLFQDFPPHSLPGWSWWNVSNNSVLKTTLDLPSLASQTLQQGQIYFDKQAAEISRRELLRHVQAEACKYKRPAGTVAVAVSVVVVSYWLRRDPAIVAMFDSFVGTLFSHMKAWTRRQISVLLA